MRESLQTEGEVKSRFHKMVRADSPGETRSATHLEFWTYALSQPNSLSPGIKAGRRSENATPDVRDRVSAPLPIQKVEQLLSHYTSAGFSWVKPPSDNMAVAVANKTA